MMTHVEPETVDEETKVEQKDGVKDRKQAKGRGKGPRGRGGTLDEEDQASQASTMTITPQQTIANWTGSLLRDIGTGRQTLLQLRGLDCSSESRTQLMVGGHECKGQSKTQALFTSGCWVGLLARG